MSQGRAPTFIHIGPSKSGSTWIFKILNWHPQVWMYPDKNLGFFSTRFDQGWDWYRSHFDPGPEDRAVGEVSHSYLVSPDAPARIRQYLPDAKLLVCLREPVSRTFSDYLDSIKNGKVDGSFEEALERKPSLIEKSAYGKHIARYLDHFPRDQLHIGVFDDMAQRPSQYAASVFDFIGVDALELPEEMFERVLPAGTPRSRAMADAAKRVSRFARRMGLRGLKGRLKTSDTVRTMLYRPYTDQNRPQINPDTRKRLRDMMADDVSRLDAVAGTNFTEIWGYR